MATTKKTRNKKSFRAPTSQDFKIVDDNGVVGSLRVKPNAIAWKARNQRQFDQITIEQLAEFAAEKGTKQDK